MKLPKLTITNSTPRGRDVHVKLDDLDVSQWVTDVQFIANSRDICRVTLEIFVREAYIDSEALLAARVPSEVGQLLLAAGWRPPEQQ